MTKRKTDRRTRTPDSKGVRGAAVERMTDGREPKDQWDAAAKMAIRLGAEITNTWIDKRITNKELVALRKAFEEGGPRYLETVTGFGSVRKDVNVKKILDESGLFKFSGAVPIPGPPVQRSASRTVCITRIETLLWSDRAINDHPPDFYHEVACVIMSDLECGRSAWSERVRSPLTVSSIRQLWKCLTGI